MDTALDIESRGPRFDPWPKCPKSRHYFSSQHAPSLYDDLHTALSLWSPTTDSVGRLSVTCTDGLCDPVLGKILDRMVRLK